MRTSLKFLLGNELREIDTIDPTMTVLDYLREREGRTGTKEGCAEGDCGACTIVLGEVVDGKMAYRTVNSCIQFVPCLDGKQLLSVEDLQSGDGALHPVQQAMVETHGSQCGFCTPGFVMSLFALYRTGKVPERALINDAIAGNLCRCTGYGPIIEAAEKMLDGPQQDQFSEQASDTAKLLTDFTNGEGLLVGDNERRFFAPLKLKELADLLTEYPQVTIIAGLTDVGLWVTKQHRVLDTVIYLGNVAELQVLKETKSHIEIGAAVTYAQAHQVLEKHYPDLGELIRRLGSVQIRNTGTVCGNIANGSPIGDSPPALIALDATLVLNKGGKTRTLPLEDFFIEYGRQDLQPSEFVEKVIVLKPRKGELFHCYKLTKRFDQDISAVCGAFRLVLDKQNKVEDIRICYGGMAGTPQRATQCEQALLGQTWDEAAIEAGVAGIAQDYSPLTDMRGSADYRLKSAQNLLRKFYLETTGDKTKIGVLDLAGGV